MPHPRLRAALVGTAGEPTMNGVLDGTSSGVAFGTPPAGGGIAARVVFPSAQEPRIVFDDNFRHEDFRSLASIMAREALHSQAAVSEKERLINASIDSLV